MSLIQKEETEGYPSSGSNLHFDGVLHCWLELRMLSKIGASVSNQFLPSEGISRGSLCRIFELTKQNKTNTPIFGQIIASVIFSKEHQFLPFIKIIKVIWKFSTPFLFSVKAENKNYNAIHEIVGHHLPVISKRG